MSEEKDLIPTDPTALGPTQDDPASFGFGGALAIWTSLDQSTDEGKALVLRCATGTADKQPEDLMIEPFFMTDILVHKVQLVSQETGELQDADRVVLVDDERHTVSFVSNGVMNSMRYIFMLYGRPPFAKPLAIRLKPVKTRRGFKTYNLDVVTNAVRPVAAAKK